MSGRISRSSKRYKSLLKNLVKARAARKKRKKRGRPTMYRPTRAQFKPNYGKKKRGRPKGSLGKKKRRGRPKGSKNKVRFNPAQNARNFALMKINEGGSKKKRGRPKGSKNKAIKALKALFIGPKRRRGRPAKIKLSAAEAKEFSYLPAHIQKGIAAAIEQGEVGRHMTASGGRGRPSYVPAQTKFTPYKYDPFEIHEYKP